MSRTRSDAYKWWVDRFNNGENKSSFEGFHFGTDNQPTGTGKASEQISDMAYRIENCKKLNKTVLLDLASHRLALSFQLAGNAVYCLKTVGLISPENTAIIVNSSDDKEKYSKDVDMNDFVVKKWDEIDTVKKQIYIVVSCYRSHQNLYDVLEKNFKDTIKVDYWDEAHLVSTTNTESDSNVDVQRSMEIFNNIFAFSATPKNEITKVLAEKEASMNPNFVFDMNGFNGKRFLKFISIKEAMESKQILPVSFRIGTTPSLSSIEEKIHSCKNTMEKLCELIPA